MQQAVREYAGVERIDHRVDELSMMTRRRLANQDTLIAKLQRQVDSMGTDIYVHLGTSVTLSRDLQSLEARLDALVEEFNKMNEAVTNFLMYGPGSFKAMEAEEDFQELLNAFK